MYPEHSIVKLQSNQNPDGHHGVKRLILLFSVCILLAFTVVDASADSAGDAAAGKTLASKQCAMCHGSEGAGSTTAPALKGLASDHLISQLQAFKSGARKNMMMEMIAKKLSDKDISDLAAYFTSL